MKAKKFDFEELYRIIRKRIAGKSQNSYSYKLYINPKLLNRKILEEAKELTLAKNKNQVTWEASDMIYFLTVFLVKRNVNFDSIKSKLMERNSTIKKMSRKENLLNKEADRDSKKRRRKNDRNSKGSKRLYRRRSIEKRGNKGNSHKKFQGVRLRACRNPYN